MSKPISYMHVSQSNQRTPDNDAQFIQTLSERQRAYFLSRESERQTQLQDALRHLARGLSIVNDLNGHAVHAIARTAR